MGQLLIGPAELRGDEVALSDESGETTWAELNARSNQLIHALRARGLCTGDTLAVLSGNRREYFEIMAAATQAGWRYVPLNWHWVGEEVAYVLENSDARAILVDSRFLPVAQEALERLGADAQQGNLASAISIGEGEAPGFESFETLLDSGSREEPGEQSLGGPMFYTSGTTGRPKGVLNSALSASAPVEVMQHVGKAVAGSLRIPAEGGRTLLEGPVYHSAQWAFSFLPFLAGNAVVMRHKFDPAETLELIDRHQVTNIHLVPTQFIRLLRLPAAQREAFEGGSLAAVWHGAAPCPGEAKRQMIEWWGPCIWEYYGCTEGSIISTISSEEWLERPASVGKATATMEIQIVREDGSQAGPGEEGQIYFHNKMGSDFEYHKDPEKTDAAHLEPGISSVGDIGYVDEDGYLHLSDRKIDMIISGGVNIYPAEIEGALSQHPAVMDAAVFGVPNEEYREEVKAAVELSEGHLPSPELEAELIAHCRKHLAGYKAPRSVDFEERLPRQPTGKLYKRLLRDRYWKDQERRI